MNRKELAQRINDFETANRKWEWSLSILYLLGLIVMALIFPRFDDGSSTYNWIAAIILILYLGGPFLLILKTNSRRINALGLRCPECSVSLAGEVGRLAVASLYCSHCGSKIIDQIDGEQDSEPDS